MRGSWKEGAVSYLPLHPRIEHKLIVIWTWIVGDAAALSAHPPPNSGINPSFILQVFIKHPEYQNPTCSPNEFIPHAWTGTLRLLGKASVAARENQTAKHQAYASASQMRAFPLHLHTLWQQMRQNLVFKNALLSGDLYISGG